MELEDTELVPYSTRVNWVRVPAEHRFEKNAQNKKKMKKEEEEKGLGREGDLSGAARLQWVW